jgi:S-DNA-T family DNA segregation ATPase FtsK/SpoIIIE
VAKNKNGKKNIKGNSKGKSFLPLWARVKIFALSIWFLGLLLLFSFFGKAGLGGEYLAKIFYFLLGKAVYFLPLIFFITGFVAFRTERRHYFFASIISILILAITIAGFFSLQNSLKTKAGGFVGYYLAWFFEGLFGYWVANIIFFIFGIIALIILWQIFKKPESEILQRIKTLEKEVLLKNREEEKKKEEIKKPGILKVFKKKLEAPILKKPLEEEKRVPLKKISFAKGGLKPYPLDLLADDKGKSQSGDIERNKEIIKNTLENFGIPVEMGEVSVGPTVTQYTLKPAEGIKLSKITDLSNNLSLALAAHPIRIEAPIPGKSLVGIEVPNKERAKVGLKQLLMSREFQESESALLLAMGRDVAGFPYFADLGKMPHLLVAGATGAGKTIFLNNLILSLLQKNTPKTLRFILVDPKRVEFNFYQELPHLLGPVIFEADKAVLGIHWLIQEMERRFRLFSSVGARDIVSFNNLKKKPQSSDFSENFEEEKMPYIVFVIDELADLMIAKGREIEAGIVRLAQLARAVGIHLVLATQRPSVEVLTGLIKANITSRVAFKVATQVDSRTILDMAGAEKLLGAGDFLYISAQNPQPKRLQAPYVSEKEVKAVVNWLKENEDYVHYNHLTTSLAQALEEGLAQREMDSADSLDFSSGQSDDELLAEAKKIVIQARKASASLLQRRLRIGYARAARLLDLLEKEGVVGPAEGAKPRKVYLKPEEENFEKIP